MLRPLYLIALIAGVAVQPLLSASEDRNPLNHEIHDRNRAQPPKVDPGPAGYPAPAPSDAIILFDGTNLDAWQGTDGREAGWKIIGDALQVVPFSGSIQTRESFGDMQMHIEFKSVVDSPRQDQQRSNSGVFIGPYEVQVLDSYENVTYADGMAGSIYGQYPPLVNASRPPGEWQTFDIVYRAPKFADNGDVLKPARITVLHNGVLVQDSEELVGPSSHNERQPYFPHGDLRILLQDHEDDPIHFRNIWVRELE